VSPQASGERVSPNLFKAVRTARTFEDIVRQVVEAIRSGILAEGDLLPGERVLAQRFEVSRPTVRSAIAELSAAGVLATAQGRSGGAKVASMWIPDELQLRPMDPVAMDEIIELLEARRVLEPAVAQLAAERLGDEVIARLEESIALQRAHIDDRRKAIQAEERFHRVIWAAADSPTLEGMLASLFAQLAVARDMVMRDERDMRVAIELHEQTLEALRRGNPAQVARAMDDHLSYLENLVGEVLGRQPRIPPVLRAGWAPSSDGDRPRGEP
jgi:GntR family transcriptional regulator, transcriptional repressor for pyruvate dehydrogenase complex